MRLDGGDVSVETKASERRLLRRAGQLHVKAGGRVYIDAHGYQQMASRKAVESLLGQGLMVKAGTRFERTPAGDEELARHQAEVTSR
jgi:hypothetical protein